MKTVLYMMTSEKRDSRIVNAYREHGYAVMEYVLEDSNLEQSTLLNEMAEILENNFIYYVISNEFCEMVCRACMGTGTKYLIWLNEENPGDVESSYVRNMVNYYILSSEHMVERMKALGVQNYYVAKGYGDFETVENFVLNGKEQSIYHTIDELYRLHKADTEERITLKSLAKITEEEELQKQTERFFGHMEMHRELSMVLSKQLLSYIDELLAGKNWDAWREILLWMKRHEVSELMYSFWQFFLLKKCVAIYSEETIQYCESGDIPCVTQIGSFAELYETYFKVLFLLRRLCYDVAPDEESEIVEYICGKKLSGIFIKHVIEHNQIEDKGKVYSRLGELLKRYE